MAQNVNPTSGPSTSAAASADIKDAAEQGQATSSTQVSSKVQIYLLTCKMYKNKKLLAHQVTFEPNRLPSPDVLSQNRFD